MSDLNLSLYKIEADLAELVSMREQVREDELEGVRTTEEATEELEAIDTAIRAYIAAEIRKADHIADLLLMWERMAGEKKVRKDGVVICELDQERERLRVRRDRIREQAEHLEGIVAAVMQEMEWKPGKPRKIEGVRHTLSLVGNGGKQPVIVSDEALVPDEFKAVTVSVSRTEWQLYAAHFRDPKIISCVPALSLISAELEKPCEYPYCTKGFVIEDGEQVVCGSCGGSGRRGVPGCHLAERAEHVRVS